MTGRGKGPAVVAIVAALLAACMPRATAPPEVQTGVPADFPGAYYQRLRVDGKTVFRVDPARSLVVLEVRRGGTFSQFGHDHIIASHNISGYIAADEGRADLYVPLGELVVDEPGLRAEAALGPQPDPADIEGTRHNMLEKVLDVGRYPYALIEVRNVGDEDGVRQLPVGMTVRGATQVVSASAKVERTPAEISVTGTVVIDQSSFGIAPFSILGGAIAVQDRVDIRFDLRAHPTP